MHEDLAAKCKRDFEELIAQLEERDVLVQEAEIKNKFVAAHLKVHNMRHSYEQAIKHRGKTKDDHVTAAKVRRGCDWERVCDGMGLRWGHHKGQRSSG